MDKLRWLHLSDFHVGKDNYGQSSLFKQILEHIAGRVSAGLAPHMVFITGDIADAGLCEQYGQFNEEFLLPLIALLPPESQSRVYVVPGNHDVDRSQMRAVQAYDILVNIPEFLDSNERGQYERAQAVLPRFRAFTEEDLTDARNKWVMSREGVFVSTWSFGGKSIGVLGVNTAWLSYSNNDRHRLSLGLPLIQDGLERIKTCELKFVLGHHPLDWVLDTELDPVRALLARHNAIYLHGHLHKSRAKYEEGAGYTFLSFQSGACFQARESEQWVNRFLWCELDTSLGSITLEPLQWSRSNREWVLDTLAFADKYRQADRWVLHVPAPEVTEAKAVAPNLSIGKKGQLPPGWVWINGKQLRHLTEELTLDQALSFFDGRSPLWREALAPQIARREVVGTLVNSIRSLEGHAGARVTLLIGAAGEGKTTALMQAVCDLVRSDEKYQVLWHEDTASPFPAEYIAQLPKSGRWIIASDDAELIAQRVFDISPRLTGRSNIQFLLCCRDTDWKGEKADRFDWKSHDVEFVEVPLRGLSLADADNVVASWAKYGDSGLADGKSLTLQQASLELVEAAKPEGIGRIDGTFFGAVLQVRRGEDLKAHISSLLDNLAKRPLRGSLTLREAFAYIAAMHAEQLLFLSREVLASVLGIGLGDLKRSVLFPLGEEAAIATTGHLIFTRHPAIARVALEILSDETDIDVDELYVDLVEAAQKAALYGINGRDKLFIYRYEDWLYLSEHFSQRGDHALAIRLAQTAVAGDRGNPFLLTKLGRLYRQAGQPELAVRVFRTGPKLPVELRGYYSEWAVDEGRLSNWAVSAWLYGLSLADQVSTVPPGGDEAHYSFPALTSAFWSLRQRYSLDVFVQAAGASAQLGLALTTDDKARNTLTSVHSSAVEAGYADLPVEKALAIFVAGLAAAGKKREIDLPIGIPRAEDLHFTCLLLSLQRARLR